MRAVTFDYWNTLFQARPARALERRKAAWRRVGVERDLDLAGEVLDDVLEHVTRLHHEGWLSGVQYTASDAIATTSVLLGDVLRPGDLDALAAAWMNAGDPADVVPVPYCDEVLGDLWARGVRLGIVCDVGLTPSPILRRFLAHHDLLRFFDHWSFSDEVGVYKPAQAIFVHALDGLGVAAAEAVHIGDIRRTDVAGAYAAGMIPVRYRGVADDEDPQRPDAPVVLDDLRELVALVDRMG